MAKKRALHSSESVEDDDESVASFNSEDELRGPARKKEKTIEQRYQKKTQLEHILLRPDTYVGSLDLETATCWVWNKEEKRMVYRQINFVPAMFKIFGDEYTDLSTQLTL